MVPEDEPGIALPVPLTGDNQNRKMYSQGGEKNMEKIGAKKNMAEYLPNHNSEVHSL